MVNEVWRTLRFHVRVSIRDKTYKANSALGGLGFRDIKAFNKAMLAKMAWRILLNSELFLSRILKTSPASWIWKNIVWGREFLEKRLRWRVATGEEVYVWKDPWIPNANGFRPHRTTAPENLNLKVLDLINVDFQTWKMNELNRLFCLNDVNTILTISLSTTGSKDKSI